MIVDKSIQTFIREIDARTQEEEYAKKKLQERFDPIFEQNRWLIEELYAEDYRKFRYERQIVNNSIKHNV